MAPKPRFVFVFGMLKRLLLATALVAPLPAYADTISIGYYNPADGLGLQTLASQTGALPNISINGGAPFFLSTNLSMDQWFGFGNISALLLPTAPGNQVPTFEFSFHDGFVPQVGGTIYLFATWQGINLSNKSITIPTTFATDEMPGGANGLYVAYQVFTGTPNCVFCDNFVNPNGHIAGGGQFTDVLDTISQTFITVAPGKSFSITEEFVFGNDASWNGVVQGDVGAYQLATPLAHVDPVPGPIAGAGLPGLIVLGLAALARWRRNRRGNAVQSLA
jgi:hypothetical protein